MMNPLVCVAMLGLAASVAGEAKSARPKLVLRDSLIPRLQIAAGKNEALVRPKILGGQPADQGGFPYMASLRIPRGVQDTAGNDRSLEHFCGGTLIAPNVVMTAGHCVSPDVLRKPVIHLGRLFRMGNETFQEFEVSETKLHPDYDERDDRTPINDIAILVLNSTANVRLVVLEPSAECFNSSVCGEGMALGWGFTEEDNPDSEADKLMQVILPLVNQTACRGLLGGPDRVTDSMVCAGKEGTDACTNDSGGPLLINGKQVGITSWGDGCGRSGKAGVWTSVPFFTEWIRIQLEDINGS